MKKIRIGHIGTAHDHSTGKMSCVRKFPDVFEVVGICEPDPARRAAAMKNPCYDGLRWMTEDELFAEGVDAVMAEGYELDLVDISQRCVDRGVHVHIDKPAGGDIKALEKLLRAAKAKSLTVQTAYMYRYNPAVLDCMTKIKEGALGEIYEVDAIMDTEHPASKRAWLAGFGRGGIMFFLGCHMVDLVYMIMGTPDRIIPFQKSTGFDGVKVIDHSFAAFEYPRGISTVRATSTEVNGYGRRQLVVCGSRGSYEINPLERPIRATITESSYSKGYENVRHDRGIATVPSDSRHDDMMLDFAAMVRGEKTNPFTYEYELQLQKLLLYCCGQDIDFKREIKL